MLQLILAIAFSIGISAFCSIAEASFYSVSRSFTEVLIRKKKKSGFRLQIIQQNMERYIAAILILNTIANTFGVAMATAAFENLHTQFPSWAFALSMTIGILLFAEIIPKTLGIQWHKGAAMILSFPFIWITKIFTWTGILDIILLLTRSLTSKKDDRPVFSRAELESFTNLSAKEGSIDPQQAAVIRNMLRLRDIPVSKIMTPRSVVFTQQKDTSISESIQKVGHWEFSRVPIFSDHPENIIGHVLRRDVYNALAEDRDQITLEELSRPIDFIPETFNSDNLLRKFLSSKTHILIVVDEYGGMSGIVTLEDVLEELLGREIVDETDTTTDLQEKARLQSRALKEIILSSRQQSSN